MQKNKPYLLCTMELPQSLIDFAEENDVLIDALPFIHVKIIHDEKITAEIIDLSTQQITVAFTSMNAAEAVIDTLKERQLKPGWDIYCMAGTTKKIVSSFFGEDAIKGTANDAATLAEKIIRNSVTSVIFFCGNQRRDELPDALSKQQIEVKEIVVYETILTPHKISQTYNGVLFFSPSAVKSFFSTNEPDKHATLFAIGRTTADTIKKFSQNEVIISDAPGKEALIKNCITYFQAHPVY